MRDKKRLLILIGLLVLGIAVPVTLFVARNRTQLKSKAFSTCPLPQDIMLVIDTSTSMSNFPASGEKKIEGAIRAAQSFVNNEILDENNDGAFDVDRVGLAFFNTNQGVIVPLTGNKSSVQSGINTGLRSSVHEGTRIHAGLKVATDELLSKKQAGRNQILILLTDGLINPNLDEQRAACGGQLPGPGVTCEDFNAKYLYPQATATKGAGITVYSVGFGLLEGEPTNDVPVDQVFADVLRQVATSPSHYFYAPDNPKLVEVFDQLAKQASICECIFEPILQIRDATTDEVLDVQGFEATSDVTSLKGVHTGPSVVTVYDPANQKSEYTPGAVNIPDTLKSDVNTITLSKLPPGYSVTDTFCFETYNDLDPTGEPLDPACPAIYRNEPAKSHGPNTTVFNNFSINCDRAVTYGYRVTKAVTPPPMVGICATVNSQQVCKQVPEDQAGSATRCDTVADCISPKHMACDYTSFTCKTVDGPGKNMCAVESDCFTTVCGGTNQCIKKAPQDLIPGTDMLCTTPADCTFRKICQNQACVEDRSPGVNECNSTPDCVKTYKTCENMACVEKQGDKVSTCSLDTDCSKMVCENEACVEKADPNNGADECAVPADCKTKHLACVGVSCQLTDGGGDDTCTNSTECYRNTCDANNACTRVADISGEADECTSNQDCQPPVVPVFKHLECSADSCIQVDGQGTNQCSTRADCVQKVCRNNACVEIADANNSPDECTSSSDCEVQIALVPTYKTCENQACVNKTGTAPNGTVLCTQNADCVPKTYKTCINEACVVQNGTPGVGVVTCTADSECKIPTYRTCQDNACVTKSGTAPSGTKLCTTDTDCAVAPPVSTYKTCLNSSCVTLKGTPAQGAVLCQDDSQCVQPVVPVAPPTGTKGAALAITIFTIIFLIVGAKLIF